jgi:peptide/nickel transport system ATP-binding protein
MRHNEIYSKEPLLKVENINFSYKKISILKDISFSVYKGEILGIVGESGSGKSTIAKSILKLNNFSKGKISYNNIDIKKYENKKLRRKIQLVFQDPYSSLNPEMSAGSSIIEPMIAHQMYNKTKRVEKAYQLLEDVGLNKNDFKKYPNQFSGGQRQRLVIARALSLNPEIVICDESVSALDVSVQAQILNLINSLKKKFSITFLLISHDLSVVRYMTDRVIIVKNGEIEEYGETDKIFENSKNNYSKKLLSANGY